MVNFWKKKHKQNTSMIVHVISYFHKFKIFIYMLNLMMYTMLQLWIRVEQRCAPTIWAIAITVTKYARPNTGHRAKAPVTVLLGWRCACATTNVDNHYSRRLHQCRCNDFEYLKRKKKICLFIIFLKS